MKTVSLQEHKLYRLPDVSVSRGGCTHSGAIGRRGVEGSNGMEVDGCSPHGGLTYLLKATEYR